RREELRRAKAGPEDDRVGRTLHAVRGDDALGRDLADRAGDQLDVRPCERLVVVAGDQHALAAERVVGPEPPAHSAAARRPGEQWSCSERAEGNARAAKRSRPGRRGIDGRLSWPVAVTTTSASTVSPAEVSSRQRRASSSNVARATSVPRCRWSSRRYSATQGSRYARISSRGEN